MKLYSIKSVVNTNSVLLHIITQLESALNDSLDKKRTTLEAFYTEFHLHKEVEGTSNQLDEKIYSILRYLRMVLNLIKGDYPKIYVASATSNSNMYFYEIVIDTDAERDGILLFNATRKHFSRDSDFLDVCSVRNFHIQAETLVALLVQCHGHGDIICTE